MRSRISRIATATVVLLVVLADVHASTLTVKVLHPRTDPYETPANRFVTFAAAALDSEGRDISARCIFTWDFGDGEKAEENPTAHQYQPGEYKVSVTATCEGSRGEAGLTVIVGKPAPLPAGGRAAFLRIAPSQMPAGKVCDQPVVECVDALPAPDAIWCNFYYKAPGEQEFSGHFGGDAWNIEWGGFKCYSMADWHSCVDHNDTVADGEWKAELWFDWEQDPVFTPVLTCGIDNTIIKAEDDCGAQYAGVLAYDPQGDAPTISWTLSHLAFHIPTDLDPPFNVRLKIYRLDGTLVFTYDMADERLSSYVDELTWEGWQGAYDDWENPLPGTPGNAPKGIYTYRMWAVHDLEGIWDPSFQSIELGPPAHECKNSDKSYRLQITDVDLVNWGWEPRTLRLYGDLQYTLSRNASEASLVVYRPDLAMVHGPVALSTSAGPQTCHLDFTVPAEPMNDFYFVVQARETAQDAALNRDGQAKMALPKGDLERLAVLAYNFAGAVYVSAGQVVLQAEYQQEHAPQDGLYPAPPFAADVNTYLWDVKRTYNRLADYEVDWDPNPLADAAVFYIGHGEPGVMLIGDDQADGKKEIWTGAGVDDDGWDCYHMGNLRFGANALRRCLVAVIAACRSANPGPGIPSVMDAFHNHGAGCAIGHLEGLSEQAARDFCNTFWLYACARPDELGEPTTIAVAFDRGVAASGSPNWRYVGNAGQTVRPAKYQGGGGP